MSNYYACLDEVDSQTIASTRRKIHMKRNRIDRKEKNLKKYIDKRRDLCGRVEFVKFVNGKTKKDPYLPDERYEYLCTLFPTVLVDMIGEYFLPYVIVKHESIDNKVTYFSAEVDVGIEYSLGTHMGSYKDVTVSMLNVKLDNYTINFAFTCAFRRIPQRRPQRRHPSQGTMITSFGKKPRKMFSFEVVRTDDYSFDGASQNESTISFQSVSKNCDLTRFFNEFFASIHEQSLKLGETYLRLYYPPVSEFHWRYCTGTKCGYNMVYYDEKGHSHQDTYTCNNIPKMTLIIDIVKLIVDVRDTILTES